ncbi:LytR cell envelope-related transcriptional attenuator [Antricoccus suffuscus]|uniref:LytR cell envelope-related transcriptional attenuator n=1 Tax=Antricoccus suffuscus TaxID=1629062 RepID=A0A2T1A4Z4_9ACTN|nr:LytR cell envelope-related transcriptional attenuator [Antricoccus suffuscus]
MNIAPDSKPPNGRNVAEVSRPGTLAQEVQLSSAPDNSLPKRSISGLLGCALPAPTARGYITTARKGSLYAPEGLRKFICATGQNVNHAILSRHKDLRSVAGSVGGTRVSLEQQRQVRRPGGRRPVPPLIFLLILAILALAVWWKVIRKDEASQVNKAAGCTKTASSQVIAELSNMAAIKVHVLNGANQQGLAAAIQADLTGRGFSVLDIANYSGDTPITSAGEIRYGPKGEFAARVLQHQTVDFELITAPTVKDDTVTLIAGQGYKGLVTPEKAAPLVKKEIETEGKVKAGCTREELKTS